MPTRFDIGLIVGIDLLTFGAIALLVTLIISGRKILATARQGHVTTPALITVGLMLVTMMLLKTPFPPCLGVTGGNSQSQTVGTSTSPSRWRSTQSSRRWWSSLSGSAPVR